MKFINSILSFFKNFYPTPIEVGQIWYRKDDIGDPFEKPRSVEIIGVRDGWVRYKMTDLAFSYKTPDFRSVYCLKK